MLHAVETKARDKAIKRKCRRGMARKLDNVCQPHWPWPGFHSKENCGNGDGRVSRQYGCWGGGRGSSEQPRTPSRTAT
eukprot:12902293-Prorocentrum_lima.AAC.1